RQGALTSSLPADPNAGRLGRDVIQSQPRELRDAQTGADREMQQRPVADARSRGRTGRIDQGLDFVGREVRDESQIATLERKCQDATNLIEHGRLAMLEEAEERANRSQADIARRRAVAAGCVQLLKERADEVRVELRECERARRRAQARGREGEQRTKGVRIRVARVRARPAMVLEVLTEERREVGGQGAHTGAPVTRRSLTAAMSASKSGVASRYQYVDAMLTCPRYVASARIACPTCARPVGVAINARTAKVWRKPCSVGARPPLIESPASATRRRKTACTSR